MQLAARDVLSHGIGIERREDLLDLRDGESDGEAEGGTHVPDGSESENVGEDHGGGEQRQAMLHHDGDRRTIARPHCGTLGA
jgi:hypothetical protein